ncbi:MAG: translation initiation factor eIF-2B [Candidatus Thorarchaeota archaeon]
MINYNESQPYKELKKVLDEIKSLSIQGATNVAIEGVTAFAKYANEIYPLFKTQNSFYSHLHSRAEEVKQIRITEPALQNGLTFIIQRINEYGIEKAINAASEYKDLLNQAKIRVGEIGAEKIIDGSTIMTHCHSSFVDEIFRKAKEIGKNFRIINTETRPMYQGRKTALRALEKNIEVIHVVDSAMWWAMQNYDVDLIIIGADSVTVEGVALNKIGSRLLALSSRELHVPLYVCTSLLKYNPETKLGRLSQIEMRSSMEIWHDAPKNLQIINPAFETISSQYIAAFITEFGLIPPQLVSQAFETKYIKGIFHKT